LQRSAGEHAGRAAWSVGLASDPTAGRSGEPPRWIAQGTGVATLTRSARRGAIDRAWTASHEDP
jgi:hypothetical protein